MLTSSHFRGSVATPALEGNDVPQVPKWQGGFSVTWADPRWFTAATQVRFSGEQFDDDLNTEAFVLETYAVWDATVSRAIVRGVHAFVAVENIIDKEFDTARTPIRSIGWPRTFRVGARIAGNRAGCTVRTGARVHRCWSQSGCVRSRCLPRGCSASILPG